MGSPVIRDTGPRAGFSRCVSTHVTFEPSSAERDNPNNSLRLPGGEEIGQCSSLLGWDMERTKLGNDTSHAAQVINVSEPNHPANLDPSSDTILDPCLPNDLKLVGQPPQPPPPLSIRNSRVGTGSFERCLEKTPPLLDEDAPCFTPPPLNGVHAPPIGFSGSQFIGVSEYRCFANGSGMISSNHKRVPGRELGRGEGGDRGWEGQEDRWRWKVGRESGR
jgi:hypothetical protein